YYLNVRSGKPQFYWYGLSVEGYHTASDPLPTLSWSHVAATYDGTNVLIYINGELDSTHATTGDGTVTANPVGLGYATEGTRYLNGMLDDARIYNAALTSNQLYSLYELGSDQDSDGVSLATESFYFSDPTDSDTDDDGLDDFAEINYYLTDPTASNEFANISGTVTYKGSSTGQTIVIASPTRFGWHTNNSVTLTGPGNFTITNAPVRSNYWIKAFRDTDNDGVRDENEPVGWNFTNFPFSSSGLTDVSVHVEKVRGFRVDFAYYAIYGGQGAAELIVSNALEWGVNTIYALAYSWKYGTYWENPETAHLQDEGSIGSDDVLPKLLQVAHSNNVKVIAWIQPVNSFRWAWEDNVSWRATKADGTYYTEDSNSPRRYLLSPFNTNYLAWVDDVINEVLDLGVDGIDISETMIDPTVSTNLTYDAAATNLFFERYPNGELGGDEWVALRSEILTSNIFARVGEVVRARTNKEYHVTFSLSAESDGDLRPVSYLGEGTGFDLGQILDLPEAVRPDVFNGEYIWQSKAAKNCDTNTFSPDWTAYAATTAVNRARGRVIVVSHPEISSGESSSCGLSPINPTMEQFETSLFHAITNSAGVDFYSHHLAVNTNAGYVISNVYLNTP
ncbi:MAG: hypothetical protein KJ626_05065, partial [Verrucomicrobia bacterium]|nr:hypothetical protein [Verrucomicrobiota bacterium]